MLIKTDDDVQKIPSYTSDFLSRLDSLFAFVDNCY